MQSTQCTVTMFFFCILSAAEKITSSIKQGLRKMFITIIFYQVQFTKFCTRQFKSFSTSKYLAIAFSFKVAVNVLFFSYVHAPECAYCLIGKIVHCEFICISFSFVHAPVCANCNYSCNCIFIQKKKRRKTTLTLVWVKIPKLCHNTPLSIFSLEKGRESLRLKTLHKN